MATDRRFLASLAAEASACTVRLPWERGLRRQAMITRRRDAASPRPSLALRPLPKARAAG